MSGLGLELRKVGGVGDKEKVGRLFVLLSDRQSHKQSFPCSFKIRKKVPDDRRHMAAYRAVRADCSRGREVTTRCGWRKCSASLQTYKSLSRAGNRENEKTHVVLHKCDTCCTHIIILLSSQRLE